MMIVMSMMTTMTLMMMIIIIITKIADFRSTCLHSMSPPKFPFVYQVVGLG